MGDVRNVRLSAVPANVDYARRMYDRAIDWYKVAELKAQLILTVNGAFVTVAFGLLSANIGDLHGAAPAVGPLTWLFLSIAVVALAASIISAAACLLSRHDRHIRQTFADLGMDPDDEATYRPEALWYFGHVAALRKPGIQRMLRHADENFEIDALAHSVHNLAITVLRKHRLINLGWLLTSAALLALLAAGITLLLRL